jgi:excisionase family DNA binding protein
MTEDEMKQEARGLGIGFQFLKEGDVFKLDGEWFYTLSAASKLLGFHSQTMRRFVAEGRLKASFVGNRFFFSGKNLRAFVESGTDHRGPGANKPAKGGRPKKAKK